MDLDAAERAKTHGQAKSKANGNSKHYGGNDWASRPRAEVDLNQYIEVKAAIEKTTGDRSEDIARIVGACVDSRLTLPHAYWCCAQRDDLVEKLNELSHDDVNRCWDKITRTGRNAGTVANNGWRTPSSARASPTTTSRTSSCTAPGSGGCASTGGGGRRYPNPSSVRRSGAG